MGTNRQLSIKCKEGRVNVTKLKLIMAISLLVISLTSFGVLAVSYGNTRDDVFQRYSTQSGKSKSKFTVDIEAGRETEEADGVTSAPTTVTPHTTEIMSWTNAERKVYAYGVNFNQTASEYTKVGFESHMVRVTVPIWKYADGGPDSYESTTHTLTVHENLKDDIVQIFNEIYAIKFPIVPSATYAFSKRKIAGSNRMSFHSYGGAIDINSTWNMNRQTFEHWQAKYGSDPRAITVDVINIFAMHGWGWGGDFRNNMDPMHFGFGEKAPHLRDTMTRNIEG